MFESFEKSVPKNILQSLSHPGKRILSNRCFVFLASIISLFSVEATVLSKVTSAEIPGSEPILLAQQINGRVAHLVCGEYDIIIRFVGTAASDEFSYQTHGLFLTGGVENETGDGQSMYRFFNNDFEYRVVTRSGGSGSLMVLHYGETLLTKSCVWD